MGTKQKKSIRFIQGKVGEHMDDEFVRQRLGYMGKIEL